MLDIMDIYARIGSSEKKSLSLADVFFTLFESGTMNHSDTSLNLKILP